MSRYVALLRGVNLGGRTVKMDALRKMFESAGYKNVETILASGNVIFETSATDANKLRANIEARIKKEFGFEVDVIVRSEKEIGALVKADPFKKIKVTTETRLYVTFLSEKPSVKLDVPYLDLDGDYQILLITKGEIVSTLAASARHGTPDVMDWLGKRFDKKITTRNWSTVLKINKALQTA